MRDTGSVMVKVTVDGAGAPVWPPRFLSSAETTQVEVAKVEGAAEGDGKTDGGGDTDGEGTGDGDSDGDGDGERHAKVSTETTVYSGGNADRFEKSMTSVGALIAKSRL